MKYKQSDVLIDLIEDGYYNCVVAHVDEETKEYVVIFDDGSSYTMSEQEACRSYELMDDSV